jgi:hypothetical protein
MRWGFIVGAIACLWASSADAGTIGELRKDCDPADQNSYFGRGYCIGFINGIIEGLDIALLSAKTPVWCFPAGVTNEQAATVFLQWANRTPQRWHERAGFGVAIALSEAFPCK